MTSREKLEFLLTAKDKTRRVFESVGSRLGKVGVKAAAAIALIKGASVALGLAGAKSFREINKASRRLNESVGDIQRFSLAVQAIDPGTGIDDIQEGLLTLTERFGEAREGGNEVSKIFKALGVDANLEGPLAQMEAVRQKLNSLSSDSQRIQLTRILFGDADGDAVLGYLRQTDDQLASINEKIRNSGKLFTDEEITNMDRANRAIAAFSAETKSFKEKVFASLSPLIQKAANYMTAFMQTVASSGDVFKKSIFYKTGTYIKDVYLKILEKVVQAYSFVFRKIKEFFTDEDIFGTTFADAATKEFEVAGDVVDNFKAKLKDLEDSQKDPIVVVVEERRAPVHIDLTDPKKDPAKPKIDTSDLEKAEAKTRALNTAMNQISQTSGAMGDALTKNGSKSFKMFKKIQIAMATAAAIQGAIAAASSPAVTVGGPFAVFGAYAAVAGHLLAGVSAIRGINVDGGGGGGVGAVATSPPNAATTSPSNPNQSTNAITPEGQEQLRAVDLTIVADTGSIFNIDTLLEIVDGINTIPGVRINPSVVTG